MIEVGARVPDAEVFILDSGAPKAVRMTELCAGKRVALFADETAIPAVYAILRAWPQGTSGTLWIETPEPGAVAELPQPKGVTCHLLRRQILQLGQDFIQHGARTAVR